MEELERDVHGLLFAPTPDLAYRNHHKPRYGPRDDDKASGGRLYAALNLGQLTGYALSQLAEYAMGGEKIYAGG